MPTSASGSSRWAYRTIADIMAGGNILLGSLVLLGGATRMAGQSFRYVTAVAPYWVWGTVLVVAGLLALLGQVRGWRAPIMYGHWFSSVVCLYWTIAFSVGAYVAWQKHQTWRAALAAGATGLTEPPQPSLTGIGAYATLCAVHATLFATLARRRSG